MAILTISRQFGSGAKAIGKSVAETMGYDYIDRNRMIKQLKSEGKAFASWTKQFEEHYPDAWGRYDWSFRGFVAVTQSMILDYAEKDDVVIPGPGAAFVLKGVPHVLRVRMKASLESRLDRVQSDAVSRDTAKWLIEKADEEMANAIHTVYGHHWDDPAAYDMVFDVSARPHKEIVDEIVSGLVSRGALKTEKAVKDLSLRALAAKIRATIAIDATWDVTTLEVEEKEKGLPEYGLVVKGIVREKADVKEIEKAVRALAGDVPVEILFIHRWYPRFGPWQFK
jgi:cytidylate kinase